MALPGGAPYGQTDVMKKFISIIIVLVLIGAGVGAYYSKKGGPEPTVTTLQVSRGDITVGTLTAFLA